MASFRGCGVTFSLGKPGQKDDILRTADPHAELGLKVLPCYVYCLPMFIIFK